MQDANAEAGLHSINERLSRLAPLILWPEAAYTPELDQYGTFLRTFFDPNTKAVRLHGAKSLVNTTGKSAARGFNLKFKRGKQKDGEDEPEAAAANETQPDNSLPADLATQTETAQAGNQQDVSQVADNQPPALLDTANGSEQDQESPDGPQQDVKGINDSEGMDMDLGSQPILGESPDADNNLESNDSPPLYQPLSNDNNDKQHILDPQLEADRSDKEHMHHSLDGAIDEEPRNGGETLIDVQESEQAAVSQQQPDVLEDVPSEAVKAVENLELGSQPTSQPSPNIACTGELQLSQHQSQPQSPTAEPAADHIAPMQDAAEAMETEVSHIGPSSVVAPVQQEQMPQQPILAAPPPTQPQGSNRSGSSILHPTASMRAAPSLEPGELRASSSLLAPSTVLKAHSTARQSQRLESGQLPEEVTAPINVQAGVDERRMADSAAAAVGASGDPQRERDMQRNQETVNGGASEHARGRHRATHSNSSSRSSSRSRSRSRGRARSRTRERSVSRGRRRRSRSQTFSSNSSYHYHRGRRSSSRSSSRSYRSNSRRKHSHQRRRHHSISRKQTRSPSPSISGVRVTGRKSERMSRSPTPATAVRANKKRRRSRSRSPSSDSSHSTSGGRRRSTHDRRSRRQRSRRGKHRRRATRSHSRSGYSSRSRSRNPSSVSSARGDDEVLVATSPAIDNDLDGKKPLSRQKDKRRSNTPGSDMEIDSPSEEGQAFSGRPAQDDRSRHRHGSQRDLARKDSRKSGIRAVRPGRGGNPPYILGDLTDRDVANYDRGLLKEELTDFRRLNRRLAVQAAAAARRTSNVADTGSRGRRGEDNSTQVTNTPATAAGATPVSIRDSGSGQADPQQSGSQMSSGGLQPSPAGLGRSNTGLTWQREANRSRRERAATATVVADESKGVEGIMGATPVQNAAVRTPSRPEVECEPMTPTADAPYELPENILDVVSHRVGPSDEVPAAQQPLDDLPYLAAAMAKFSSGLFMVPTPADGAGLGLFQSEASSIASQASTRIGRPYRRELLHKLLEDAREIKSRGDRMFRAAKAWSPLSLLKYLESSCMYLEVAYGQEQGPDREKGTSDALQLLDSLTHATSTSNGMLRIVEQHANTLLKAKRAKLSALMTDQPELRRCMSTQPSAQLEEGEMRAVGYGTDSKQGGGFADSAAVAALHAAQGEVMTLHAIVLLAQHLIALSLSKMLILKKDAMMAATQTLAPPTPNGDLPNVPAVPVTQSNTPPLASNGRNGRQEAAQQMRWQPNGRPAAGNRVAAVAASPPPADSASSTLEAVNNVSVGTWTSSIHTLTACMRQYANMSSMWKVAAAGAGRLYHEASLLAAGRTVETLVDEHVQIPHKAIAGDAGVNGVAAPWARQAQIVAALIISLGYEWGVWDLLGSVTVARQALEAVVQLPGVDSAQ